MVTAKNRSLLKEFVGHISIDKPRANSLLTRMQYVKRNSKGSTLAKLLPGDFKKVKTEYLKKFSIGTRQLSNCSLSQNGLLKSREPIKSVSKG